MSRSGPSHRLERRPPRRPVARSRHGHRAERRRVIRPRVARIAFAATAFAITLVAVLGGIGVIPVQHRPHAAAQERVSGAAGTGHASSSGSEALAQVSTKARTSKALPADSGTGRRIVFSAARQRVWLVGADGKVESTYLVSGSLTDNLHPGSYSVYSRSRWAVGIDDSGTMQYFVRFAHGVHAAIGFHSIPTLNGHVLQTKAQLGTPQSHGCIRQDLPDAIRLWDFAPIGTRVVVTA